jgi:tRNA-uridine 2-sulfurtransferase
LGESSDELLALASQVLLRYTKAPAGEEAEMSLWVDGQEKVLTTVHSLDEAAVEALRL